VTDTVYLSIDDLRKITFYWPTSAPFSAAFHVSRAAAFHRKAEIVEPLISVLRMHPNGQQLTFGYTNSEKLKIT